MYSKNRGDDRYSVPTLEGTTLRGSVLKCYAVSVSNKDIISKSRFVFEYILCINLMKYFYRYFNQ